MNFSKVEHPGYVSSGFSPLANDIVMLRLHRGIDLNNYPNINSICWPTVSPAVGVQAMTSGWGLKWQHFGIFGTAKVLQKVINELGIFGIFIITMTCTSFIS